MRIAIVGTGYVGLVSAACFAELGHEVIGVDIDAAKVKMLKAGKSPIYEPGLEELIQSGLKSGRLMFTTDLLEALPDVKILFSAVATPPSEGYKADLRAVFSVTETVAQHVTHDLVFVNKSTVPVGTGKLCEERMKKILKERRVKVSVPVVSNPEFLREGLAVADTLMPDRIVVGTNGRSQRKQTDQKNEGFERSSTSSVSSESSESSVSLWERTLMAELYRPITRVGKPLLFMSRESAEIVKYASNAFLATKISFINMISELAEVTGASVRDIASGMGLDHRIGTKFLHAGIGYGGSCFPKDVKALLQTAKEYGVKMPIVEATDSVNIRQRQRFIERVQRTLPKKSTVAVWGLAFKPKTDDMREAPSLDIIPALIKAGHIVRAFDPVAMERARPLLPRNTFFATSAMDAVKNAGALLVLTEWDEFRGADLKKVRKAMKGDLLFDGRNVYEPGEIKGAGMQYFGIGISDKN